MQNLENAKIESEEIDYNAYLKECDSFCLISITKVNDEQQRDIKLFSSDTENPFDLFILLLLSDQKILKQFEAKFKQIKKIVKSLK